MEAVRLISEPEDVENALRDLGLELNPLLESVRQIAAAYGDTVSDDSKMAAGMQAFLAAIRYNRLFLKPLGFVAKIEENVEYVHNPDTGISLFYQRVDRACSKSFDPQVFNKKGSAGSRIISNQMSLFSTDDLPEMLPSRGLSGKKYVLGVSLDKDHVAAELLRPARMADGLFVDFIERIFLVDHSDGHFPMKRHHAPEDIQDFSIVKK